MTLTYDDFVNYLINWCNFRGDEFRFFFPLKGGWEAWVQADFAAYVIRQNSAYDILREQPIYNNPRQTVDWLFNEPDLDKRKKIAVELKCQSFLNSGNFLAGVGADMGKLAQGNLKLQFQTCQTIVMGIYFEQSARDVLLANGFMEVYYQEEIGCAVRKLYPVP